MKYFSRKLWVGLPLAAAFIFFVNYHNYCPYDYYKNTPFVSDGPTKDERRKIAERNTLKTLSAMIKQCPQTSRYIVSWSYDGEGAMAGYVEGKTVFDRRRAELRESFESAGWFLIDQLTKVSVTDIHAVAQANGDIDTLKNRLKRGRRKPLTG